MSYCTFDDIQTAGFFRYDLTTAKIGTQTAQTVITNDIIPAMDAYIEDALRMYYVVPVDATASPLATKTLKRIEKWLVAAEVASRINMSQTNADSPNATTWKANADADLAKCQTQGNYLADAVKAADSPDIKSDLITDNISQSWYTGKPFFTTGKQF